jgi:hypothetical protein
MAQDDEVRVQRGFGDLDDVVLSCSSSAARWPALQLRPSRATDVADSIEPYHQGQPCRNSTRDGLDRRRSPHCKSGSCLGEVAGACIRGVHQGRASGARITDPRSWAGWLFSAISWSASSAPASSPVVLGYGPGGKPSSVRAAEPSVATEGRSITENSLARA